MTNLLNEVNLILVENGKNLDDIKFITCDDKLISREDFLVFAINLNYNDGYGGVKINLSLKIVGNNWWLERHEYDGSEWFEFKTIPIKPLIELENMDYIYN